MQRSADESKQPPPTIHFLWFGPIISGKCDKGPIAMATKTNPQGEKYPILFWVEPQYVDEAQTLFIGTPIHVQCIDTIINDYCQGDEEKKARIETLLELCRRENLPTVAKEILTPMLMATYPGYYLDTSIAFSPGATVVNLPSLKLPALPRHLSPVDADDDAWSEFKVSDESAQKTDLYAYFTPGSEDGKRFFSDLADKTIRTWDHFFKDPLPENDRFTHMINHVLLGPVLELYETQRAGADEGTFELKEGQLALKQGTEPPQTRNLLTIDGVPDGSTRKLYINGEDTFMTKVFSASWKENFNGYLEKRNADETARKMGWTPLYIAVMHGNLAKITELLSAGADINQTTTNGSTPLYIAILCSNTEVIPLLLDGGADVTIPVMGKLPLAYALENGNEDILRLVLEKYNLDENKASDLALQMINDPDVYLPQLDPSLSKEDCRHRLLTRLALDEIQALIEDPEMKNPLKESIAAVLLEKDRSPSEKLDDIKGLLPLPIDHQHPCFFQSHNPSVLEKIRTQIEAISPPLGPTHTEAP